MGLGKKRSFGGGGRRLMKVMKSCVLAARVCSGVVSVLVVVCGTVQTRSGVQEPAQYQTVTVRVSRRGRVQLAVAGMGR